MASIAPLLAQPGRLVALAQGASYPLRAMYFLTVHRLWHWALIPAAVALVVWAAAGVAIVQWLGPWAEHMWWYGPSGVWTFSGEHWAVLRLVLAAVLLPPAVLWATWMTVLVAHVLASPAMALLSQRVEDLALGRPRRAVRLGMLVEMLLVAAGDLAMGIIYLPLAHLGLLAVVLVPGLGGGVALGAAAMALAHQFVGLPLARRWVSYRLRWRVVREHRWMCIGLGGVLTVAWVLPVINLLALPVAACAGTLAFCDLLRRGALSGVQMRDMPGPSGGVPDVSGRSSSGARVGAEGGSVPPAPSMDDRGQVLPLRFP